MSTIVLRWPAQGQADWRWLEMDAQGQRLADGHFNDDEWPTWVERVRGRAVQVLLPTASALVTSVIVPSKQQRHLARVLPFLIEDVTTSAIDDLHIVAGRKLDAERYQVIAVAQDLMLAVQQRLQDAQLVVQTISVDGLCLPVSHDAQLLIESEQALLALPDGSVQALPNDSLDSLLPILVGDRTLSCHRSDSRVSVSFTDAINDVDHALAFLAPQVTQAANLLQGPYAIKQSFSGQFGQWKWPAVLLSAALFTHYAYALADWWVLKQRQQKLQTEMTVVYNQAFPGNNNSKPYADLKKQMKALEGGGSHFLSGLEKVSSAFSSGSSKITAINFDADRGDLKLSVLADDLSALNSLQADLQAGGLNVEMGQASAGEQGYSGTLTIHEGKKK